MKRITAALLTLSLILLALPVLPVSAASEQTQQADKSGLIALAVALLLILVILLIHCAIKWLVAKALEIWFPHEKLIFLTGIIAYILQWGVFLGTMICFTDDFLLVSIPLIVLIYLGEFLFYCKKMESASWKRCLVYTVATNLASLAVAMLAIFVIL